MYPLNPLLRGFVKQGHLRVIDHQGRVHHYGEMTKPPDVSIRLHDGPTAWRIARNPAYYIGQAYTDGLLTLERGTLLGFLGLMLRNLADFNRKLSVRFLYRMEELITLPAILNWSSRSRRNVKHHYDLSEALFSLFLDKDRQYSCAYYRAEDDDLDAAQLAKKQHIAAKLFVHPGQHILDVGCGWGGLALYLAEHYPNVRVTGLTLSDEQYRLATERARQAGLADRVTFKLADYREEKNTYDRIVSVGMFEHVGKPQFGTFFERVLALLKPGGVAVVHTIGQYTPPAPINPWVRKNIFPGAYLPTLSQLTPILEQRRFWLADMETLRLHYAETLADWNERFQANRDKVRGLYDERFCRMWEFYLQCCEAGFRWGGLTVFQLQLATTIDALPITRDYMVEEEARLREVDAELPVVYHRSGHPGIDARQ
jgi:cyclopropane-fatty-acyl-phospholipid synthase